ncbi:MAG: hypothetical protein Aurels2KO_54570 [Aureliella sp.]
MLVRADIEGGCEFWLHEHAFTTPRAASGMADKVRAAGAINTDRWQRILSGPFCDYEVCRYDGAIGTADTS